MHWLCKLFGHRWQFVRNERIEDNAGAESTWWYEISKCDRCGAEAREIVASPRG